MVGYSGYQNYLFNSSGIITIAKVVGSEAAEQGYDLYLKVSYNGKEYDNIADGLCSNCRNKYFYVRIIENSPTGKIIFYNEPVPECILNKPIPIKGWKIIPKCE